LKWIKATKLSDFNFSSKLTRKRFVSRPQNPTISARGSW
jgi:hypothetical protein